MSQTQNRPVISSANTANTLPAIAAERLPYHPAIAERFGVDRASWRALVEAVFPTAKTTEAVLLALSYCRARRLDPMKRVVHIVPIWDSAKKSYVETVWPGIGELRTTAMRTGLYAGCDECEFGPDVERKFEGIVGSGENKRRVEVVVSFPEWARVTVYRMIGSSRCAVPGPRTYWNETYASQGKSGVPNDMWQKRPRGQLEKCAEAAALRRAFPEEIGNDITVDEVQDARTTIEHNLDAPVIADIPMNMPEPPAEASKATQRKNTSKSQHAETKERDEMPNVDPDTVEFIQGSANTEESERNESPNINSAPGEDFF